MKKKLTLGSVLVIILFLVAYFFLQPQQEQIPVINLESVPEYTGEPFVILQGNVPQFERDSDVTESYETYGGLDSLGRCTQAFACIGQDIMPTEERGSIGQVKPSGWQTVKYDFVDGKYLYNRCHLIGFQLTGENANENNLITGTRYMNVEGMLPFENMVADYVKETGNHVLYRVVPVFDGDNLVASGVTMEAYSVEDDGDGICFYVYVYNVQPGVVIDYSDGSSYAQEITADSDETVDTYIANTASKKFHLETCQQAANIKEENREVFNTSRSQMLAWDYVPAGCCNP